MDGSASAMSSAVGKAKKLEQYAGRLT